MSFVYRQREEEYTIIFNQYTAPKVILFYILLYIPTLVMKDKRRSQDRKSTRSCHSVPSETRFRGLSVHLRIRRQLSESNRRCCRLAAVPPIHAESLSTLMQQEAQAPYRLTQKQPSRLWLRSLSAKTGMPRVEITAGNLSLLKGNQNRALRVFGTVIKLPNMDKWMDSLLRREGHHAACNKRPPRTQR